VSSDELRDALEHPEKLAAFAGRLGLTIHEGDTPTAVMTRALQLAERADNLPIL